MKSDLLNKKKLFLSLALVFSLVSCGTTRGVFHGTGMVLEGMAVDAREIGNWIK